MSEREFGASEAKTKHMLILVEDIYVMGLIWGLWVSRVCRNLCLSIVASDLERT